MSIYLLMPARLKYEKYFKLNEIDIENSADEMIPRYKRVLEIGEMCKKISEDEARDRFSLEVGELFHAIKLRDFVCKVGRIAYIGDLKMIAEFWGDYYVEINFDEVLQLPEVQKKYPELSKLRNPEIFKQAYPAHYHVFFGEQPEIVDVTSDFIWHYGKRIKEQVNVENYQWVRGW